MQDSTAYQYILFDADNTILDFNRSEKQALHNALSKLGIPFDAGHHPAYHRINKACWEAFEHGEISRQELRSRRFELFFKEIGQTADKHDFAKNYLQELAQGAFLVEGALPLVKKLSEKYRLGLVTNGLKEVQRPRLKRAGLDSFFDVVVVSDEIGHSKPHPEFFEYTFGQLNNPPKEQVLIVGDNINADIRGGAEFGIHTCWYNPEKEKNPLPVLPTYEIAHLKSLTEWL